MFILDYVIYTIVAVILEMFRDKIVLGTRLYNSQYTRIYKAKTKYMSVYGYILQKNRVGRSDFHFILFFHFISHTEISDCGPIRNRRRYRALEYIWLLSGVKVNKKMATVLPAISDFASACKKMKLRRAQHDTTAAHWTGVHLGKCWHKVSVDIVRFWTQ
jgi:hypothetical protein